jgi:hypothetical protein
MNRFTLKGAAFAIVVACMLPAVSRAQEPILSGTPPAGTTAALTAQQKADLIAKLEKAKARDKNRRANHTQNPIKQGDYDEKIDQINRLVKGLQAGQDFQMDDVNKAMRYPKSDVYH